MIRPPQTRSAGSIALVMAQDAEATVFGTPERWEAQSRAVLDTERDNGMKIFTKSQSGRFYILAEGIVPPAGQFVSA